MCARKLTANSYTRKLPKLATKSSGCYNETMSTILKPAILEKIKPLQSTFLKVSIWAFVAGVILSVVMILAGDDNFGLLANYGRILGIVFLFACSMLIAVNNFKRLESDETAVSALALTSLISNAINFLLWTLIIWGVFPLSTKSFNPHFTAFGKIAYIVSTIFISSFFASNILLIGGKTQSKNIRPLKITSLVCLAYESLFCIISILIESVDFKLSLLAGFASFVWIISSVLAVVISISSDSSKKASSTPKSDAELRAEIEAKVRAEVIEKEVRARIEAEQNQNLTQTQTPQPPVEQTPAPQPLVEQAPAPAPQTPVEQTSTPTPIPTPAPIPAPIPTPTPTQPPIEQPPIEQTPVEQPLAQQTSAPIQPPIQQPPVQQPPIEQPPIQQSPTPIEQPSAPQPPAQQTPDQPLPPSPSVV